MSAWLKNATNSNPEKISTNGYCQDIFSLQYLHFPNKNKKLKTGNKSCQDNKCLQFGQKDLPLRLFFSSCREIKQFKKLPMQMPNKNTKKATK